jgi:hypothetical protein
MRRLPALERDAALEVADLEAVLAVQPVDPDLEQGLLRLVHLAALELRGREVIKDVLAEPRIPLSRLERLLEVLDRVRGVPGREVGQPVKVLDLADERAPGMGLLEVREELKGGVVLSGREKRERLLIGLALLRRSGRRRPGGLPGLLRAHRAGDVGQGARPRIRGQNEAERENRGE